ncbi:contactin-1a, partial [Tachysurus ichikawai]
PPGAPGGVRVEEIGVRSVKLLWSHGTDNHSPISKYIIQYRETTTDEEWKDAVTWPPGAPGGVRVEEIGVRSVKLLWSHGTDNHSPISKYIIQYRETTTDEEWKDAVTSPRNLEGNAERVTVVDLLPWTEYEFRVIATNTLGTGEPSEPSSKTTTLEAAPVVAPSDVGGGGGTGRELTITWTPVQPQYYYGNHFGYIITFKPNNGTENDHWHRVTISDPRASRYVYKDPSIPPATKFDVKVKAFNNMGEGPYSLPAVVYSAQDAQLGLLHEVMNLPAPPTPGLDESISVLVNDGMVCSDLCTCL